MPSWQELQSLGLRKDITSPKQFMDRLQEGYAATLDQLRARTMGAPTAELLRDLHREMFANILESPGRFRTENSPQMTHEISSAIDGAADKCAGLFQRASDMAKVNSIAAYASSVMKEKPFQDTQHSFVNRTITACVMESQLEHCFGQGLQREVDAHTFSNAVDRASRDMPRPMRDLVRDMTGGKANVIDMQQFRQEKNRTMEHER